jgi:preprotein translocase subunit SecY
MQQLNSLAGQTKSGIIHFRHVYRWMFSKASVLGIMPYISASIVVQLMGIAIPYLQNFKVMASGRKRLIRLHVG